MNRECGCERGDDCTKTTVCAIESALQDQAEEHEQTAENLLALREAVKSHIDTWPVENTDHPLYKAVTACDQNNEN